MRISITVGLAVSGLVAFFALVAGGAQAHGSPGIFEPIVLLDERGPIEIMGDHDFTPANGVRSGSGTPEDPYVLARWRITGAGEYGIEICDTTASWRIEDVLIEGNGTDLMNGIWLSNVAGGEIRHVTVHRTGKYGLYGEYLDGLEVHESSFEVNRYIGVYTHDSHRMLWQGNRALDNFRHGLYLANGSSNNTIRDNQAAGHRGYSVYSIGIYSGIGANDNVIELNTAENNGMGIQVNEIRGNVIRGNTATGNEDRGISVSLSSDSSIEDNVVLDNGVRGILLAASRGVLVRNNVVEGTKLQGGIEIHDVGDNVVTRNVVRDNPIGIYIVNASRGNLIYDNLFANDRNALDVVGDNLWNVSKRPGPNVVGDLWIAGNYWSDLTEEIHDHDEDGLGEAHGPYNHGIVSGGDFLPLTRAVNQPISAFSVSNLKPATYEEIAFRDASVAGRQPIVNWTWDFGDGTRAYARDATHRYLSSGSYRVIHRIRDGAGLYSVSSQVLLVQNAPPTAVIAGAPEILTRERFVTFDGSRSHDSDGYVVAHEWSFGDGNRLRGEVVTHAYASDGIYAAALLVTDNRLASGVGTVRVVLDRTPPVTAAVLSGERGRGDWYVSPVALGFAAADPLSGVARTELDSGAGFGTVHGALEVGEGDARLRYRSVDRAGNEEKPLDLRVRVDLAPPVTALAGPDAVNDSGLLSLDARDAASGVRRTYYRIGDEREWRVFAEPFTLAGRTEGPIRIEFWSEDHAGHEEGIRSRTILLDRTPPAVVIESPAPRSVHVLGAGATAPAAPAMRGFVEPDSPANAAVVKGTVDVRYQATDFGAGAAKVRIFLDGDLLHEATAPLPNEWVWNANRSPAGSHLLIVRVTDAAGNVGETKRHVLIL